MAKTKKSKKKVTTGKKMTKAQIFSTLAETTEMKKSEVIEVVDALVELAYKEAHNPKGFTIPGLGKLLVVDRKARMGRNPATGETIKIAAKKAVKFRIIKVCKDTVLPEEAKKAAKKRAERLKKKAKAEGKSSTKKKKSTKKEKSKKK